MADGMHARVEGLLPASPPRRSLLDVPGVRVGGALLGTSWRQGVAIQPESCSLTLPAAFADLTADSVDYPYWWESCQPGDVAPETAIPAGRKNVGAGAENVVAEPFTIWTGYRCSTLDIRGGPREAEIRARLLRKIEACTPATVEHELWTGQVATAAGFANPFLQQLAGANEILGGTPLGYVTALAEIEQELAECYCSGEHLIHAQPRVVTAWAAEGLVQLSPDRTHLQTLLGTAVVPGSGYTGEDPNSSIGVGYGLSYVYGTGAVRVFLSTAALPDLDSTVVQTATNTMDNTLILRAERDALVLFDNCCWTGAAVSLCDRTCGAGS